MSKRNNVAACTKEHRRMRTRKNLMAHTVLFCAFAGRGWAIAPLELDFPMIGGSLGQTIQLNIRGVGDPQISTPRCQATLSFQDSRNVPVGTSSSVDLGPGQAASLILSFNQLVSRAGQRLELRPVVRPLNRELNFACQTSVEIYEPSSGRTTAWAAPPNPGISDPEENLSPVSGALGQTIRFGVVRGVEDPNQNQPCTADLALRNSRGAVVVQKRVALQPGQADALDLNMNTQLSRLGERLLISPSLSPVETGSTQGCVVSVQVFDQSTGWTTTYIGDPDE
jgi:hypothetical protein